jgi:signal transduction histidine kinase
MVGSFYCGYRWGISFPATFLMFSITIQVSFIVLGSWIGSVIALICMIFIILLGVHEYNTANTLQWISKPINRADFIKYSVILVLISGLSWISSKKIEKSLKKTMIFEKELMIQRDMLEIKVEERIEEIKSIQLKRMGELAKLAEFGRLSQGLIHDLMSPMASMGLHIEKIKYLSKEEIKESYSSIEKIIDFSKKIAEYTSNIKNIIKIESEYKNNSIDKELQNTIELFKFKANSQNTTVLINKSEKCSWYGDPIKLNQIFSNIISNGIDACSETTNTKKQVIITLSKLKNNYIEIIFSDNGCGISKENLSKIFDPFYTTKTTEYGTGIGLTNTKRIIEEFSGTILVSSTISIGTTVTISIPPSPLSKFDTHQ